MVQQGFAISHRNDTSATFTRRKPANTDIGCLLLLLGIVPGLLYFGLFKGTWTTTVFATTGPAETQLMISGDDRRAQTSLHRWVRAEMGTDEAAGSPLEEPEREACWKCGSRTTPADVRCPSCGAWQRPQTARVPTSEADVAVAPPPQQEEGITASPPQQDQSTDIKEWWQTPIGKTIGILVAIIVVLTIVVTIVVNLAGGEETGSQANRAEKQQEAQKAQEQGSGGEQEQQQEPATEPTDPFANSKYYTFLRKENNKSRYGDQLILGLLAGSESDSQIDKIAREIDYDKSKYEVVTVRVLTKEDVTEKQIANMTREDETVTGLSGENFKQSGVLVISNSAAAKSAFDIPPGEHTYFTSYKEMQQAISQSAAEKAGGKGPEQEAPHSNFSDGTYQVGTDIQPGTYRTREGSPGCYYARLRGFSNEINDILANANTYAPAVVTIKPTDAGFQSQGCGTWTKDLSAITGSKTSFGAGTYIVGTDIEPGTYRSSGSSGCYYERLRAFTADMNSIIANGNTNEPTIVTIAPTDAGFQSQNCGTWTRLE
jgi:hypothetical protein